MKPETEATIMKDHFMKSKKEAVTCLRAMGAELPEGMDPCSWEGVMTMYEDVLAHGKADKRAAAGMAVMKWMHYHEECATYEALEKAKRMLESEMEAPAGGELFVQKLGIWLSSDDLSGLMEYVETGVQKQG